jgi:hypothetical protein
LREATNNLYSMAPKICSKKPIESPNKYDK